jgi:hypothetical protein
MLAISLLIISAHLKTSSAQPGTELFGLLAQLLSLELPNYPALPHELSQVGATVPG